MTDHRAGIFIVEDDALIAMEIRDRLMKLGYTVCGVAARGEVAIGQIGKAVPDLVLMDVNLAGELDGIETARRLRGQHDLPVVFLTAYSDDDLLRRAGDTGPFGFLTKPFEERELHATIQMALYKHRMERALREANARLETMVEERTAQLRASEQRFAAFAEIGADWLWETDQDDNFVFFAGNGERAGLNFSARQGRSWRDGAVPTPENMERVAALEEIVRRTAPFRDVIYLARFGTETPRWCSVSGQPRFDSAGNFLGYRGVERDVSDVVKAREAIESRNRILDAMLTAMPDAVAVTETETVLTNQQFYQIFDLDEQAARASGNPVYYGIGEMARRGEYGPGDPEIVAGERIEAMLRRLAKEGSFSYERQLKTGRWIESRIVPLGGRGRLSLYRDITAQREAEQRLLEAQRQARIGNWQANMSTGELVWSKTIFEIFGRDPDTFVPSVAAFSQAVHPDDSQRVRESERLARETGIHDVVHRILRPDGEVRYVHELARPMPSPDGQSVWLVGTVQDVTEREESNKVLYEYRHLLSAILETSHHGFWSVDNDVVTTDVNPAMCRILGRSREDIVGKSTFDFVDGENTEILREQIERRRQGFTDAYEIELTRPDGTRVPCINTPTPLYDENGRKTGTIGIWTDISERKRAEIALRTSEADLREAQRIARLGSWSIDLSTGTLTRSDALLAIFGRDRRESESPLQSYFDEIVHPDDVSEVQREQKIALTTGEKRSIDHRFRRPDGTEGWVTLEGLAEYDEAGRPIRLRGTAQDITQRKQTELALRDLNETLERRVAERTLALAESERFSRATIDAIGAHLAVLDRDGRIITTNAAWRRFAGNNGLDWQAVSENANYLDVCENALGECAEDARAVAAGIRAVAEGRSVDFAHEYPCHSPERKQWFLCRISRFGIGEETRVVVAHEDVTAVHEASERIAAGERVFSSLSMASPVGVFRADPSGRCEFVNARWSEIAGLSLDQAMGDGWLRSLHPDDRERIVAAWTLSAHTRAPFQAEYRFLRQNGAVSWVIGQAVEVADAIGGLAGYIGTITDITERKKIELAMRAVSTDLVALEGSALHQRAAIELAELLDVDIAFVCRPEPGQPEIMQTLALVENGALAPNISCPLIDTPLGEAGGASSLIVERDLHQRFPKAAWIVEKGIEALACEAILDPAGAMLGHIGVMNRHPLQRTETAATILKIFSAAIATTMMREQSRRQYRDLFEFAPGGLIMADHDGHIVLLNQQAEDMFGWTRKELIGQPVEMLIPFEKRAGHTGLREAFQRSGSRRQMAPGATALTGRRKDGSEFPAEIDLAPIIAPEGTSVVAAVRDISQRMAAEAALATARAHLGDAIESITHSILLYDKDDRLVVFNHHFVGHFPAIADLIQVGIRFEDLFRAAVERGSILVPDGQDKEAFIADRVARHRHPDGTPMVRRLPDGRVLQVSEHPSRDGGVVGIGVDITAQLQIEQQLREAQKMEAIGKLTGGMAHDFNNYLGVIIGNLDLLQERYASDEEPKKLIDAAVGGALRGAELTRSLLAFASQQPLDPEVTDANEHIEAIAKLMKRTLGEDIVLTLDLEAGSWPVTVDGAQLESCILNLANNARDAMDRGGKLSISTRNVHLDAGDAATKSEGNPAGDHVLISVADNGTGMPPDVLAQVFEPFFTTKGPRHGTGLGLSMVYGFVKQSGGHIDIDSVVGRGTTVNIYLPRKHCHAEAGPVANGGPRNRSARNGGSETILVVEDNEEMRRTVVAQLGALGYRMLEAGTVDEAIAIIERRERDLDLVFTDVVMPGNLDGYDLARLSREKWPDLKVLLTSGFSRDRSSGDGVGTPNILRKPYRRDELAHAVRAALTRNPV